jgi:hypothetical protein
MSVFGSKTDIGLLSRNVRLSRRAQSVDATPALNLVRLGFRSPKSGTTVLEHFFDHRPSTPSLVSEIKVLRRPLETTTQSGHSVLGIIATHKWRSDPIPLLVNPCCNCTTKKLLSAGHDLTLGWIIWGRGNGIGQLVQPLPTPGECADAIDDLRAWRRSRRPRQGPNSLHIRTGDRQRYRARSTATAPGCR